MDTNFYLDTDNTFSIVLNDKVIKTPLESITDIQDLYDCLISLTNMVSNNGGICEFNDYSEDENDGGGIEVTINGETGSAIFWFNTFNSLKL